MNGKSIKMPSDRQLKEFVLGKARDFSDSRTFHKISLVAVLAWIGLGTDGISSSAYGPEEAFRYLGQHRELALFVALGTIFTIFIISTSYKQIIKLFPHGGGGYLVASKLLSPTVGMISGSALLIDYLLTITLSISSGADAIFSFLPAHLHSFKLLVAVLALVLLIIINMRGVKESVLSLTPIFFLFIATHVFIIFYIFISKVGELTDVAARSTTGFGASVSQIGFFATMLIILKAYSMGAGTFTGIEAVSNGLPILRDPKPVTARKTMNLMAVSLSFLVFGLLMGYALYNVEVNPLKTLNAVLLEASTGNWNRLIGYPFVTITLFSEAALLFVAAQTGFLDGPRIMANMAADQWLPKRFASLSDRLVNQRGVMMMGVAAIILMILSRGKVSLLVVLYSINVFITFTLSQTGMVRHWWMVRKNDKNWKKGIIVNGIGLILTSFILASVIIIKFREGGWMTLLITSTLVLISFRIRKHYYTVKCRLQNLRVIAMKKFKEICVDRGITDEQIRELHYDKDGPTAIILVSGFGGTGLTSLMKVIEKFPGTCANIIFLRIGILNSKNFKGSKEMQEFKESVIRDGQKYVWHANKLGYYARSFWTIGTDPVYEVERMIPRLIRNIHQPTFFGGQLVFAKRYSFEGLLHNHTIFMVQRKLFKQELPVIILPINVPD
ncbi:MAG TPA: APC family permease [Bacteroidales bacterium]|nr:APC family permease [Bacteroidales bacterium]